jgi:hypothetical protein
VSVPFTAGEIAIWPLSKDHTPSMLELAAAEVTPTSSSNSVPMASSNDVCRRREPRGFSVLEGAIALTNDGPASFFHSPPRDFSTY